MAMAGQRTPAWLWATGRLRQAPLPLATARRAAVRLPCQCQAMGHHQCMALCMGSLRRLGPELRCYRTVPCHTVTARRLDQVCCLDILPTTVLWLDILREGCWADSSRTIPGMASASSTARRLPRSLGETSLSIRHRSGTWRLAPTSPSQWRPTRMACLRPEKYCASMDADQGQCRSTFLTRRPLTTRQTVTRAECLVVVGVDGEAGRIDGAAARRRADLDRDRVLDPDLKLPHRLRQRLMR
mmetsp:Transcript_56939/g.123229  ORF Transcript_56939/g.123229 Transcript_56939/m.123229 type:complete len:242 (+) Transcript_56939:722-1447(+)